MTGHGNGQHSNQPEESEYEMIVNPEYGVSSGENTTIDDETVRELL